MNTRTTRKMRLGLPALAALTLVAAACGGDDANDDASSATDAPETTEMAEETMAPETTAMDDMTEETMAPETTAMDEGMELASEPFGPACGTIPEDGEGSFVGMADDPAATAASNNPALSTLVSAVQAAGLVDTLNSEGPFTIFAPVNDAFAALDPATLDAAMADPEGLLTDVLTYHVIAGESLLAADLDGQEFATVNGGNVSIDGTTVNGANIVCADVPVANGTVHIIDSVLIPGADQSADGGEMASGPVGELCSAIPADGEGSFDGMADDPAATAASNNPELSTLVTAVDAAGLVDTLNGEGPFTIFAPANSAFEALPQETLDAALADPSGLLTDVLTYHVIAGDSLDVDGLVEAGTAATVNGGELTFETNDEGTLLVNGVEAGCQNVTVANGTVHIITEVLIPS